MHPEPFETVSVVEMPIHKEKQPELGHKAQYKNQYMNKKSLRRERKEWTQMAQSAHSKNTVNPIRRIADAMTVPPNPNKPMIKLHLGDPTITGELPPAPTAVQAMVESVTSHAHDGYGPSVGDLKAREAVAAHFSTADSPLHADDVVLASGASHALQMAIESIADPGDNILVPHPGFPLYTTLMRSHGIEDRGYRLDMANGGLIDLAHLESQIDEKTRAIIVNNPGNPVGNVLPKWHLEQILQLADRLRVPIIADEIYGDIVYDGATFHYMATLSPKVPIISCDGLAKRWMVPGWRMGWCNIYDRYGVLAEVKKGMVAISQKIVGPCSVIQGALPKILQETPQSFFEHIRTVISKNGRICYEQLRTIPGLRPVRPHGAMYMMVEVDPSIYGDETTFSQELIREQSVFCLPGAAFFAPGWIRLVLTFPETTTTEACERIREFCTKHFNPTNNNNNEIIEDEERVEISSDEGIDNSNTDSE